jgi:hypothetical protein
VLFTRELGLGPKLARVLSKRSERELKRIEQTVFTIVDSVILYDPELLNSGRLILRDMVRKVFAVGSTNLDLVLKYWKEFTNIVYIFGCRLVTFSTPSVDRRNFFVDLLDLDIDIEPQTKKGFERLMSFVSTRGLPPTSDTSTPLRKFKELVSTEFKSDPELLRQLTLESYQLGSQGPVRTNAVWHYSVNHAGSLMSSVREGGKASEMMSDYRSYYVDYVPTDWDDIDTPFGVARERPNLPRWKTFFRTVDEELTLLQAQFPGPDRELDEFDIHGPIGLNEGFATQVFYLAYLMALDYHDSGRPIPTRVVVVHEQGAKARVVSCGPWWSQVLLAPYGHATQESLKSDYDGNPCLFRSSPAWDAFLNLGNVYHRSGIDYYMFSDMTSCTDAYPKDLARSLLSAYWAGCGIDVTLPVNRLAFWVATSERDGIFEDGSSVLMERGVLMGEPMTKSLLSIFMCAVRRLSLVQYAGSFDRLSNPWFFFHIGGDDHFVHGPEQFLRNTVWIITTSGFIIDGTKYGITSFGGKYLQSPFLLEESLVDIKDPRSVFTEYDLAVYCDNVKTKLLGPHEKPHTARNELNVAIGKAKALGKTLGLLRDKQYAKVVRSRFLFRMGRMLPSPVTESGLLAVMFLPQELGGLGLAISEDEFLTNLQKCPAPTRYLVSRIITGQASYSEVKMHSRLSINHKHFSASESFKSLERLLDTYLPDKSLEEATQELKIDASLPFNRKVELLENGGIYTLDGLVNRVLRLKENLDCLELKPEMKNLEWKTRYWHLWRQYEPFMSGDIHVPTNWQEVRSGIERLQIYRLKDGNYFPMSSPFCFNTKGISPNDPDWDFMQEIAYCSFLEAVEKVFPPLRISFKLKA